MNKLLFENRYMVVCILPDFGGNIWSIVDKQTNREWLWHNPKILPHSTTLGSSYDNNWIGGWDDLFPNDAPGFFDGRELPDHGEWWCQAWQVQIEEQSQKQTIVRLTLPGLVSPTICEKWITLEKDSPKLKVRYRIQNQEDKVFCFLLKLHPAIAITPWDRLDLPGGDVEPVDLAFSTLLGDKGPFKWPMGLDKNGAQIDLRRIYPQESSQKEFIYVKNVLEGWCGVVDTRSASRIRLYFPRAIFPHVWLFMTFGGWYNCYTVVLEPCTNVPKDLSIASKLMQCGSLPSRGVLDFEVNFVLERL